MIFDWDSDKDILLKKERGISFRDVVVAIERGDLVDVVDHPNKEKYPHQRIMFVKINDYVYTVPYVKKENKLFLKTVYPDRKATKKYLR